MLRPILACILSLSTLVSGETGASWIGPSHSSVNQWLRFRNTFSLAEVPARAQAVIAADSKYWLWLNGTLVVRAGGLKRGPSPDSTYYDTADLAPHLKPGENTLAILLWHFGKPGFSHNPSGRAGLLFELSLPGQTVASDASWQHSPHPAIGTSPGTPPNRRLPESSLLFDARKDEAGWAAPGFNATQWTPPTVSGKPPTAPWGPLVKRPIPQWKDYGLKDYTSVSALPEGRAGVIKASLPYNAQVTPWLKVDAPAGLEIDIRTDNFMGGGEANVHAKYTTRDGIQEFECLGWMNGHEVHYTLDLLLPERRQGNHPARLSGG